jgi:hypothetical protein
VPDRTSCSPSSMELSSQASWNSGARLGEKAGVRPLPRLKRSIASCSCLYRIGLMSYSARISPRRRRAAPAA